MYRVVALAVLVGCGSQSDFVGQVEESERVVNFPTMEYPRPAFGRRDLRGASWSYCGSEKYLQSVRDVVSWWSRNGAELGEERPCGGAVVSSDVEILDVTQDRLVVDGFEYNASQVTHGNYHQINLYRGFADETEFARETILKHEFGHLFGFAHSENPGCVMHNGYFTEGKELCREEIELLSNE